MPLSVTGLLDLAVYYSSPTAFDFQTPSGDFRFARPFNLTSGTGANQGDLVFADTRSVAASTNDDIDLAGSLTNTFGATITFARIKGMFIYSSPANVQNFSVGGGTNPFINWIAGTTPTVVLRPGGLFAITAPDATGFAVTAGTGDILRVANGAGSTISYDICLIGSSA